jgi:predicted HTH domain antitoxin
MNMTIRDLMHLIDEAIDNYFDEYKEKGENYNINTFLNSQIILGNDDELNGIHLCKGFLPINEEGKRMLNELDLGVELEEDKNYVLLS